MSDKGKIPPRRELIKEAIEDLVLNLLDYERREDDELPRGAIEAAVRAGEITIDEMIKIFADQLREDLS